MTHSTDQRLTSANLSLLPEERPRIFLLVSLLAIVSCIALSQTFFPNLGPSQEKINSPIEAQRWLARVTLFEIAFLRGLLLTVGIASALIWIKWEAVSNSRFVAVVSAREPYPLVEEGRFNGSFKIMMALTAFLMLITGLGSVYPVLLPEIVVIEDGLIEYFTAFLFVPCSIIAFVLARREPVRMRKTILYILAIGFFFCFGEELSWGQRIFDFSTPDTLMAANAQGEVNLHNSFGYAADHLFRALVLLYGVLIPVLAYRSAFMHRLFDYTGIPIASIGLAIGFFVASLIQDVSVYQILPETYLRQAEVRELICAVGFLLLMLETRQLQASVAASRKD